MQHYLAALPDADDPRVLYEIRQTRWGGLLLIQLTPDFGPSPYAWMNRPKITGDILCAEHCPDWLAENPHLQSILDSQESAYRGSGQAHPSPRSQPARGMSSLAMESIYLDPG